jgi:hypothetical protein
MSRKDKGRISFPFIPMLLSTVDSPAWCELSHGAQCLYIALKFKCPNRGNRAYLSTRDASRKLKVGRPKVREWFAELEHYGFIVMLSAGCLGSDGYGKAPHWRLTEKGNTSKHSPDGLLESPTNDFLKWDGVLFDQKPYRDKRIKAPWGKKQNPGTDDHTRVVRTTRPVLVRTTIPGKAEGGTDDHTICANTGGTDDRAISSVTTIPGNLDRSDPRYIALEATSKRLKQARRPNGQRS